LLRSLSTACGQILELAFSLFRFRHGSLQAPSGKSTNNYELYQEFIDDTLTGGLGHFFVEYPALEKLVTVCMDQWTNAAAEFLELAKHRDFSAPG
jgi:lantibiotic modifying enzyme